MVEALKNAGGHVEHDMFAGSKSTSGQSAPTQIASEDCVLCLPLPALEMLYDEHHVIVAGVMTTRGDGAIDVA
jgi:hypothetical protein